MTAEVIVMNKVAIAAATDSAVTIRTPIGQKIYQSANKLFALSKYAPIGIMVYGAADFMEVPWETIVKTYRDELGRKSFSNVGEYVEHFLKYLEQNRVMFSDDAQKRFVVIETTSYLYGFGKELEKKVKEHFKEKAEITEDQVSSCLGVLIKERLEGLQKHDTFSGLSSKYPRTIMTRYKEEISKAINQVFKDLPLSNVSFEDVRKIIGELFYRAIWRVDRISGLVIMGLGDKDVYPEAHEYNLKGIAANKIGLLHLRTGVVTRDNDAMIIPFAQREMVNTFMEGVDPKYSEFIIGTVDGLFRAYAEQVIDAISDIPSDKINEYKEKAGKLCDEHIQKINDGLNAYRRKKHVDPILTMIGALPKDELAGVAEALVSLTSFKRRVSVQEETVAEPIDVAVISRGDGFVWIKRKHYFPAEINPTWTSRYLGD